MKSKLIFLTVFFLLCSTVFYSILSDYIVNQKIVASSKLPLIPQSSALISPSPQIGIPIRFIIPSLNIDTTVESVGLDDKGRMDVPKNVDNVGWYSLGFKPGERGNAVIAGHLDSPIGPAIFFRLRELQIKDRVVIVDDTSHRYNFIVTDKKTFPFDQVPLKEVFGDSDKPLLNLITCEGVFNQISKNYSDRTVIYTQLE